MGKVTLSFTLSLGLLSLPIPSFSGIRKVKTGWNSVYHQNWSFSQFHPPLNTFLQFFFFESHPVYDQTQGSGAVFFLLYTDNSTTWGEKNKKKNCFLTVTKFTKASNCRGRMSSCRIRSWNVLSTERVSSLAFLINNAVIVSKVRTVIGIRWFLNDFESTCKTPMTLHHPSQIMDEFHSSKRFIQSY
jgi:hypothetical protein